MPGKRADAVSNAVIAFSSRLTMPRTNIPMVEWFEEKRSFTPHPGQMQVIEAINNGAHEIDICCGKRSGKSLLAMEVALYRVLGLSQRVWIMGPTWDIVDRIWRPMWGEIRKDGIPITDRQKESRLIRTANGGLLEGVSWASPEQIEGEGVHVVITDESQYLTQDIYDKIRARLVGDWLWLRIGSPAEGGMSFYEDNAFAEELVNRPGHVGPIRWPTWLNPCPEVQETVRIELDTLEFLKESRGANDLAYIGAKKRFDGMYGGESVPSSDVVLSTFRKDVHVRECKFDPDSRVILAIDPGFSPSHYAVVALQAHQWGTALDAIDEKRARMDELWAVDEVYLQQHTTSEIIKLCQQKPWWKNVEKAVIDVAARQTSRATGKSELYDWQSRVKFSVTSEFIPIEDNITVLRRWVSNNRLFFDKDNCPNTIKETYMWKMRARKPGEAKDVPIDRFSHCLAGDTIIDMPGARVPISQLVGTQPWVYCVVDGKLSVRRANRVWKSLENAPTVRVLMDRGELQCTPDHLIMLVDGTYKPAKDLRPTDRLMSLNRRIGTRGYSKIYLTGSGGPSNHGFTENILVYEQTHGPIPPGYHVHHLDLCFWNHAPENLVALSPEDHTSLHAKQRWLENHDELAEITRKNVELAHLANVGREVTEETREKLSKASSLSWEDPEKRLRAAERWTGKRHAPESIQKMRDARYAYWERQREGDDNHKVWVVLPGENMDVYDIEVPDAHNFVANGVVVHNSMKALGYMLCQYYGLTDGTLAPQKWMRQIARPDRRVWA